MEHEGRVKAAWISDDKQTVLTETIDNEVRLWRPPGGTPVGDAVRLGDSITSVTFSADGLTMLIGSSDNAVRLWRTSSGKPIGQPIHHGSVVESVAFAAGGKTAIVKTYQWLHIHAVEDSGLVHQDSRFLESGWSTMVRLPNGQLGLRRADIPITVESLRIEGIGRAEEAVPRLEGNPDALLEEWQRRLALVFDADMNLVPRWPVDGGPRIDQPTVEVGEAGQ